MKLLTSTIVWCLCILLPQGLLAQYQEHSSQSGIGIPFFDLVLHKQYDTDFSRHRLLLMAQFLNDDLTFVKSDTSGYDASFELLLAVYDEQRNVVVSKTINKNINVQDYGLTNSRQLKYTLKEQMRLPAGKYELLARSVDLMSSKSAQRKVKFKLDRYDDKKISISGILFFQAASFDSSGKLVDFSPTVDNNFNARSGYFYIYFDLFVKDTANQVKLKYSFANNKNKVEFDTTVVRRVAGPVSSHLLRVDKKRLTSNRYNLKIVAISAQAEAERVQNLSFYWSDVPGTVEDIDEALQQMMYIVEGDSLKKYEKADLQAKQGFFKRFWKSRDPNPNTSKNELKNEYFKRVNYANQKFSAFSQPGWITDRGRILIKFGFPDDVERHPFDMGSRPYEIWRYYSLRKTFVFEDRTGFGDFRLHPAYLDVEFQ